MEFASKCSAKYGGVSGSTFCWGLSGLAKLIPQTLTTILFFYIGDVEFYIYGFEKSTSMDVDSASREIRVVKGSVLY